MSETPRQGDAGSGAPPGPAQPYQAPGQPPPPPQQAYAYPPPPSAQPYPQQPYPPQPYAGQPPPPYPGGYAPAYPGYTPTVQAAPFPVSTFVLLVVSVLALVATGILGIPSAVISVVAWRRHGTDQGAGRRLTTTGWVVFAVNFVVAVPLLIWFYVWALGNQ